jgi:hypothetical protein
MTIVTKLVPILPILLAAATAAPAQEAIEVLRKAADTYKSAKSYALVGVDTLNATRPFHAWRLGQAMRVDFADGAVRLTDGRFEWNSLAKGKPFTKKAAPWDSRGRHVFQEFFYNYEGIADFVKSAGFIAPPGKDGFLLEVKYELPGRVASEVMRNYWIDAQRYTVLRETSYPQIIGPSKAARTITFSKVDLNATVEESRFTPPPDEPRAAGPAPDFDLADLNGSPVSMQEFARQGRGALLLGDLVRHLSRRDAKAGETGERLRRPRPGAARHQRRRS